MRHAMGRPLALSFSEEKMGDEHSLYGCMRKYTLSTIAPRGDPIADYHGPHEEL
jgi:hypothetical protein